MLGRSRDVSASGRTKDGLPETTDDSEKKLIILTGMLRNLWCCGTHHVLIVLVVALLFLRVGCMQAEPLKIKEDFGTI